jgi:hypothetical protein
MLATFTVTAGSVSTPTTVTLTGSYSGTSMGTTVNINPPSATAVFQSEDTTTQGTWKPVYGQSGYTVVNDSSSGVTTMTPTGQLTGIWTQSTNNVRALEKGSSNGRIAAAWYSPKSFSIDVDFTDQAQHQLAVYCLDWDNENRSETITVLDAVTNAVLDTRTVSNFSKGVYMVWSISGNVKLQVVRNSGFNAVVSGVFLH